MVLAAEVPRAVAAAKTIAAGLGVAADDAVVLQDSNTLTLRLLPGDVVARVAHRGQEVADLEVEIARRLAETGSPVARLAPGAGPHPGEADGFVVTLWTHYAATAPRPSPGDYADALVQLHHGMRTLDVPAPHFTDRVASAQRAVANPDLSPDLSGDDRSLLGERLVRLRRAVTDRGAPEQLIHGEPHPGNLISTTDGVRFIDLETCCYGPVELDLAHVPEEVSRRYPQADSELLVECRALALAMVAAWRWERDDQLPDGRQAGRDLLRALRAGPPWPTLDEVMPPIAGP